MRSDIQLARLRAKTDLDLASLFQRRIGRSLQALDRGNLAEAESEYGQAATLLFQARGLPDPAVRRLRTQLTELRAGLDRHCEQFAMLVS